MSSLLQNPEKGKTPESASAPKMNTVVVHGIDLRRPPISRMSCVCVAWMIAPAPRKSSDLKNACVIRWKSAATSPPVPSAMNM